MSDYAHDSIRADMKLYDLLKIAAKLAKGKNRLYDPATGQFCLWGMAAHLVGVRKERLANSERFDHFEVAGADEWDEGNKEKALRKAACAYDGVTVEQFRRAIGRG
jgi:hypothetical protein